MPNNNPFDAAVMKGLKLPMDTEITNSDFSSTLKGLEKLYGQKRVLASDYYTFIEKVAKKTNLKQLQDDLKTAKEGTQLRIDLEKKLQTTISEIQKKAYEGAAAKYRNVYNLTFTEVAVNANKTLMKQEQDYRKSLDDTLSDRLEKLREFHKEELDLAEQARSEGKKLEDVLTDDQMQRLQNYQMGYSRVVKVRNRDVQDSLKRERKLSDENYKREQTQAAKFIKSVESKSKVRQQQLKIEQEHLEDLIEHYKEMEESGASAEDLASIKSDISKQQSSVIGAGFKAELTQALSDAVNAAMSHAASAITDSFHEVENIMTTYNAPISARLQGSGNTFKDILDLTVSNVAASPFVKAADVLAAVKQASDEGIAYNIEQRAFLSSISDKIASTFDAFDSNLTRLIRIQQADITAARLGMEASLTKFLNENFLDTSYLSDLSKSVSAALIDAESVLDRNSSAEFEYVVQKWLGSLSSLGMSSNAISSIAQGINYLATGNVSALASNQPLQTLFAMSASRGNLSYSDLLLQGLNANTTNKLLESMVEYLKSIAEGADNLVVRQAYGDIFNMSASDFRAIQNLTAGDIRNISSSTLTYSGMGQELMRQFMSLPQRVTMSEKLSNVYANAMFGLGNEMFSNPVMYAMMKMLDVMDELGVKINIPSVLFAGTGLDLNTDVNTLMRLGVGASATMGLMGNMLSSLFSGGGLNLSSWGGTEYNRRGSGTGFGLGTLLGGTSESISYVTTGSSKDMKTATISQATEESKDVTSITNKGQRATKTLDDFYDAVVGENATSYILVKESYLSGAYDSSNKWIRVSDAATSGMFTQVFGTDSFYNHTLKVTDDAIKRYAQGNILQVHDAAGVAALKSALAGVKTATQNVAQAQAAAQVVRIDEKTIITALQKAMSTGDKDKASLQSVLNVLQKGELRVTTQKSKPLNVVVDNVADGVITKIKR